MSLHWNRFFSSSSNTRRNQSLHRTKRRRLSAEALETRQLLAANMFHNVSMPEDVNQDGTVTAIDALTVINEMNRQSLQLGNGSDNGNAQDQRGRKMTDVNNDGRSTAIDALIVINRLNRNRDRIGPGSDERPQTPAPPAPTPPDKTQPPAIDEVRSIDGSGNNLENPELGSAGSQLIRIAEADYSDGIDQPAGSDRPSAREISNVLSAVGEEDLFSQRDLSAFLYVWGQFLDHDIDLSLSQQEGESFDIAVPTGDALFDPQGTGKSTIPMSRSMFDALTGTSIDNPRQQINAITVFVDGSQVYGSDAETASALREFVGGRMTVTEDNLLPVNEQGMVIAGDIRASENPSLTAIQTLFVREHNRIADRMQAEDPSLTDEEIYQAARRMVIAQLQAITYNEFLPALLGRDAISRYEGYDATVDPSIANEFSTAAFRFGHSTLNDDIGFFDNQGLDVRDEIALKDAFFNTSIVNEMGIDAILKYDASSLSQEIDLTVVDSLRNFLFGPPGSGGLDLAALNIQRGRDHGLADYNATRTAYGLPSVESFADITSDPELQSKLETLYGDVNNIDLWVGLLAEDHVRGASVGELTKAIIADQFERLRDGDRFWYQNTLRGPELRQVERTTLADVIKRNTDVDSLQPNVFFFKPEISGRVTLAPPDPAIDGDPLDQAAQQSNSVRTSRPRPPQPPRAPNATRPEAPAAGVVVELLTQDGEVVETAVTDQNGRYRFASLHEAGSYQVRIAAENDRVATDIEPLVAAIESGNTVLRALNFSVTPVR